MQKKGVPRQEQQTAQMSTDVSSPSRTLTSSIASQLQPDMTTLAALLGTKKPALLLDSNLVRKRRKLDTNLALPGALDTLNKDKETASVEQ